MKQTKYDPVHWWVITWDGDKPTSKILEVRRCRNKTIAEFRARRLRSVGNYAEVRGL